MQTVIPTRVALRGEALINEETLNVSALFTTIFLDISQPRWMINQLFKGAANLDAMVQLHACYGMIVAPLGTTIPAALLQVARELVEFGVEFIDQFRLYCISQNEVSLKVKEVVLKGCRCAHNGLLWNKHITIVRTASAGI